MQKNILINVSDKQFLKGLNEIKKVLPIELAENGLIIKTQKTKGGLKINRNGNECSIYYGELSHFYRAIGLLCENINNEKFTISENPAFEKLGLMYDSSRNAVLKIEGVKKLLRHMALMGYNRLQLYTEDLLEIENEPYFGHFRGRYKADEIKEIDSYANMLGIELMPCIQSLAHLACAMKWDKYNELVDCNDILLVGHDKTYEFIENVISSVSKMFSSKNINVGMDEAHMLGLGKYLNLNGYKKRTEIMLYHIKRVVEICNKYSLKPFMWSDMFFDLTFGGANDEIKRETIEQAIKKVPKEMSLIYWDYYSIDEEHYDKKIKSHKLFNNHIQFAGGAWKWVGFAPNNKYSEQTSIPAIRACIKNEIKDVLVTAWGDDGGECPIFSVLPSLQLYAEGCYNQNLSHEHIKNRFKTCINGDYDAFMALDLPNELYEKNQNARIQTPSKYLFYNDPLMGMFDSLVLPQKFKNYFSSHKEKLLSYAKQNKEWAYLFETLASLCDALELKCDIGIRLKNAYDKNDKKELFLLANEQIPEIISKIEQFYQSFRKQWYKDNKPNGFDIQDIRIGGLIQRLKNATHTVNQYLNGDIEKIYELEEERIRRQPQEINDDDINISFNCWIKTASPNYFWLSM